MDSSLRKGQNLRAYRASTQLHTDGTRDSHTLGWGMPLTSSKAPTASHTKKKRAVHPTMEPWRPNRLNQLKVFTPLMASGIEWLHHIYHHFFLQLVSSPIIVVTPSNNPPLGPCRRLPRIVGRRARDAVRWTGTVWYPDGSGVVDQKLWLTFQWGL